MGAIRNMMNPTRTGPEPEGRHGRLRLRVWDSDSFGVHTNSGVPNHAYALMVDGGSFNGRSISGIGLTKAGKVVYRTLASYLLSGSDFLDFNNAMRQSCSDLVGSVVTATDCAAGRSRSRRGGDGEPVALRPGPDRHAGSVRSSLHLHRHALQRQSREHVLGSLEQDHRIRHQPLGRRLMAARTSTFRTSRPVVPGLSGVTRAAGMRETLRWPWRVRSPCPPGPGCSSTTRLASRVAPTASSSTAPTGAAGPTPGA